MVSLVNLLLDCNEASFTRFIACFGPYPLLAPSVCCPQRFEDVCACVQHWHSVE